MDGKRLRLREFEVLDTLCGGDYASRDVAFTFRSPRTGSLGLINEVQQAVWSVDSNLPVAELHTLDYHYMKSMARTSFTLVMLSLAGGYVEIATRMR